VNSTASTSPFSRALGWLNSDAGFRALIGLFAATVLVFGAIGIENAVLDSSAKDYELWHDTGQRVLKGEEIYPAVTKKFPFMYPPPCAIFLAPVSLLGQTGVVIIGGIVNAAAWLVCI
jgi:hypothetical protein